MPRDAAQEKRDNINRGIPEEAGLDAGTRASLEASLAPRTEGIKVGSFRDLQTGASAQSLEDRPVNPNEDDSKLTPVTEMIAAEEGGATTTSTSDSDDDN